MASHARLIKTLLTEVRDCSYRTAWVVSAVLVTWVWLLTWVAQVWPSLTGLVACLAVPYVAWTYLPAKLVELIELALAPGLVSTPDLPMLEGSHLTPAQWSHAAFASLLLAFVAGALYASLTRPFDRARGGRRRILRRWALAQALGSLVTASYLFLGLLIEAHGRTTVLAVLSNIADWLVYFPMRAVRFVYGQEPTLQRWGDWGVGTMLASTGLLTTLIALELLCALIVLPLRHRIKV